MVPNGFDLIVRLLSMFKWNQPQPPKTSYNSPYQSFSVFKIGQKPQFWSKLQKLPIWYNFDRFETNLNIFSVLETQIQPRSNSNHILRTKIKWNDSDHTGIILSLKIITIFDYSKPVRKNDFLVIPPKQKSATYAKYIPWWHRFYAINTKYKTNLRFEIIKNLNWQKFCDAKWQLAKIKFSGIKIIILYAKSICDSLPSTDVPISLILYSYLFIWVKIVSSEKVLVQSTLF